MGLDLEYILQKIHCSDDSINYIYWHVHTSRLKNPQSDCYNAIGILVLNWECQIGKSVSEEMYICVNINEVT